MVPIGAGDTLRLSTGVGDGTWPVEARRGESGFFAVADPSTGHGLSDDEADAALGSASVGALDGIVVVRATSAGLWVRGKKDAPGIARITFGLRIASS